MSQERIELTYSEILNAETFINQQQGMLNSLKKIVDYHKQDLRDKFEAEKAEKAAEMAAKKKDAKVVTNDVSDSDDDENDDEQVADVVDAKVTRRTRKPNKEKTGSEPAKVDTVKESPVTAQKEAIPNTVPEKVVPINPFAKKTVTPEPVKVVEKKTSLMDMLNQKKLQKAN